MKSLINTKPFVQFSSLVIQWIIILHLQLAAEVLFLATASISGLYYRIMSDAAHNRTVDGTRTGIHQRVKLECEREQQEQLLLSVIPAYIAAEVTVQCFLSFHSIQMTNGWRTDQHEHNDMNDE